MGYLQEKQLETQRMLEYYNYELSEEVTNRKKEWEKEISKRLENEEYNGVLNIESSECYIETEFYDDSICMIRACNVNIVRVYSNDGEVYICDTDGEEFFMDDLTEAEYESIYNAVVDLTEE